MQIYIHRNGQRFGPYSLDEIKSYLASDRLRSSDLAWHSGAKDWIPLGQLPGLSAPRNNAPPPPPPITTAGTYVQHKPTKKSAATPFQKAVLITFVGMFLLGGVISTIENYQDEQKEKARISAYSANLRKKHEEARRRASDPKFIAAEHEKTRRTKEKAAQAERELKAAQRQTRQADIRRAQRIEKYLKESFGHPGFETSWYLAVKREYNFVGDTIRIHTNLSRLPYSSPVREEFERLANATCLGASGYLYANENPDKQFKKILILSNSGQELDSCP